LWTSTANADQYRSETRELESTPAPAREVDTEQLLKNTTDPYARALLLRDLAWQALNRKDYGKASKYLEESLALGSLAPAAQEQMRKDLTQLQIASGEPAAVIKALEAKVKNDPKAAPELQAALAGAYLEQKRYKDALPLLQAAVAATPRPDERWLQALYAAHVGAGQQKEAVPVLEKLVRVNPGRREYWVQLAGLTLKSGNKERTLALLELASRQGHLQGEDERLQVVALTAELGAPFEAGSLMQSWMESGQLPRHERNWEMLGGLWIEARESELAFHAVNKAIEQSPRAELYLVLGQQHMNREEYPEAALALAEGLSRGTATGPLLTSLGVASYYSGNVENARKAFSDAARHGATAKQAREWLVFLDSTAARDQAKVLAAERRSRPAPAQVALSSRLSGETVDVKPLILDTPTAAPDLRRIGGRLTDVGAEADANSDGSIPAWEGGLQKAHWPSAFKPGGRLLDPYANDKPLFVITAANAAQYAGKLSNSHKLLLSKHPGYKLPVYQTRRSASYPQAIYDATQANIGKAKLIGSDALTRAKLGFPFPLPQNGVEVMWNHRTRFRGNSFYGITSQAVVSESGMSSRNKSVFRTLFRYGNIKDPADIDKENIIVYGVTYLGESLQARADFVALFHETANSIKKSRGIWVLLNRMGGKMMRIPPVGYDQPYYGSEGLFFIDMIDMYNGAFDRYVWKLIGKREMYIPYNAYRINDGSFKYDQLLRFPHINQDATRYELHRVWVIEATEREGTRHAFGKRMFYVDEDSWNVVLVENHDPQGKPWRFQEGHLLNSYDIQSTNSFPVITYDLKENRYFAWRMLAEDPPLQFDLADIDDQEFLPAAVKRKYSK
jgi:tetratricopeptide (TPR) repeat protein